MQLNFDLMKASILVGSSGGVSLEAGVAGHEEEIEKFFGAVENPEDPCGINKIAIQNNVVTIQAQDMGKDNNYNPGF